MSQAERLIGGRYRIVKKVAEGGMGTVFEAEHNLTRQTVALKVLHPNFAQNDAARQRFLREASAPAKIGHIGICPVFDAGFDDRDGSAFVAMELLRGETLRERFQKNLSIDQRLDLIEQTLEPLAAAHEKGIVHRDMKPENVFVSKRSDGTERIMLLDFGIVREPEQSNVTQAGMGMGTPEYMSPEQATSAKDVLASSDVWSLGVMLYEALGGSAPFQGRTPSAIVVEVITRPHVPLRSLRQEVSPAMSDLIDRCLSKEPEVRPRDAGELLHLLKSVRKAAQRFPATAATPIPIVGMATDVPTPAGYGTPQPTPTPAPGGYGTPQPTPTPGDYGAPSQGHAGYGTPPPGQASGPFPSGAGAFGAPTPTPGFGTPAPVTPPVATPTPYGSYGSQNSGVSGTGSQGAVQSKGSFLPMALIVGLGAVFLLFGGIAVLFFAFGGSEDPELRVITNLTGGELLIDGASKGLVVHGQRFPLSRGTHRVELRMNGTSVVIRSVEVSGGGIHDVLLQRPEQTREGELAFGDETLQSGEFCDIFEFDWPVGGNVQIDVTSSAFDSYVIVHPPTLPQLENDDLVDGQTNAGLTFTTQEAGQYRVRVTSYSAGEVGAYQLRILGP